jgi:hypothetical protein
MAGRSEFITCMLTTGTARAHRPFNTPSIYSSRNFIDFKAINRNRLKGRLGCVCKLVKQWRDSEKEGWEKTMTYTHDFIFTGEKKLACSDCRPTAAGSRRTAATE